jgi:hypothetical protein
LIDGWHFYERQERGLGDYFLDSLYSDVDSLQLYAGVHQKHGKYHRVLSRRFPFAIYYRHNEDVVVVHAVLDCRRSPAWIRARLNT